MQLTRRTAITALLGLGLFGLPTNVLAQSVQDDATAAEAGTEGESAENLDALPGILRVSSAGLMRPGLALGLTFGYGYTEDVLQLEDTHHRMGGALAASFRPQPWLAAGFRLGGRYDRHRGAMIEADDGWVGEARVNLLVARAVADNIGIGGQLVGWVPGGLAGFSLDAKAIATITSGPAQVSGNLGFRLDRSAESVDDVGGLSPSDRLALGVSDSNAVLLGAAAEIDVGPVMVVAEATWDLLVGADAPSAIESPLRVGAGLRVPVGRSHRVAVLLEGSLGRAPFVSAMEPLVPVEPLLGVNLTISQRPSRPAPSLGSAVEVEPVTSDSGQKPPVVAPDQRAELAGLSGIVRDDGGALISGAVVRVAGREVLTGESGEWVAEQLAPGEISVEVSARGFNDAQETVTVAKDEVREINLILRRVKTGELRGVVRGYDGSPLRATVKITPGNHSVTSADDGTFKISLPAGNYTATAKAAGFRPGGSKASIEVPGPTVIINIELQKSK